MKNKNIIYITAIVVIAALSITIFYISSRLKINEITLDNIYVIAAKNEYTLLHLGPISSGDEKILKQLQHNYKVYLINSKANEEDREAYLNDYYNEGDEYLLFINGTFTGAMEGNKEYSYYEELMDKYIYHVIPDADIKYKTPKDAEEFYNLTSRKKEYTIAVFGYADCSYCTLYKPVINEIANDYNLDIYYIDGSSHPYYEEIVSADYEIPAKCTKDNKAVKTSGSFATPMTLIIKENKTVDCIRGYVPKSEVESVLKNNKIIK